MAFYYIKTGGTAVGDAGREVVMRSGTWNVPTADYYATPAAAIANSVIKPTVGDTLLLSSTIDVDTANFLNGVGLTGTTVVSVDDASQANYLKSARYNPSGNNNIVISAGATINFIGFLLEAPDDFTLGGTSGNYTFNDCELRLTSTGTNDGLVIVNDKTRVKLINTLVNLDDATNSGINLTGRNCSLIMDNCRSTTATKRADLISGLNDRMGAQIEIKNTDLNSFLKSTSSILSDNLAIAQFVSICLDRCKIPANLSLTTGVVPRDYLYTLSACDVADGYHYFYQETPHGIVEENTINYLTATYDAAQALGFSADLDSSAQCSVGDTLSFKLATQVLDLTTSKALTVNFTCDNALTDADFWIEVLRPDAQGQAWAVTQSSRALGVLTGALHTTNAAPWTLALANTYEQSVVIPALSGVDTAIVSIIVHLAKPLETVIVCPDVVVS